MFLRPKESIRSSLRCGGILKLLVNLNSSGPLVDPPWSFPCSSLCTMCAISCLIRSKRVSFKFFEHIRREKYVTVIIVQSSCRENKPRTIRHRPSRYQHGLLYGATSIFHRQQEASSLQIPFEKPHGPCHPPPWLRS